MKEVSVKPYEGQEQLLIDDCIILDACLIEGNEKACPHCKRKAIYHDVVDSFLCAQCNCWLESVCKDPDCNYCAERLATPLPSEQERERLRSATQRIHYLPVRGPSTTNF